MPGQRLTSRLARVARLDTDVQPILVGYDDSRPAQAALRWAAGEALRNDAVVVVAYAISPVSEWMLAALQIDSDRIRVQRHRELRGPWTQPLRACAVPYQTRLVSGRPGPALLDLARSTHASCIVIGADRHRRLGHWSEGPVQRFVQHHAQRPVVSVPPDTPRFAADRDLEIPSTPPAGDRPPDALGRYALAGGAPPRYGRRVQAF
jgi:nucleotide-binding universal stress UspA family protein